MDGRMTQRTVNAFGQSRQYFAGAALNNLRCAFQNQPAHAFDPAHRAGHLPRKRVADFLRRGCDSNINIIDDWQSSIILMLLSHPRLRKSATRLRGRWPARCAGSNACAGWFWKAQRRLLSAAPAKY